MAGLSDGFRQFRHAIFAWATYPLSLSFCDMSPGDAVHFVQSISAREKPTENPENSSERAAA